MNPRPFVRAEWLIWSHHGYWYFLFVALPLALSPQALLSSDASGLATIASFRGALVAGVFVVGLLLAMVSFPTLHLRALPRAIAALPLPIVFLLTLIAWLVLASLVSPSLAPVVAAIGSAARIDGTLVQAAWFGLALVSAALIRSGVVPIRHVLTAALLGAVMSSVWVVLQATGHDPLAWLSRSHVYLTIPAGAFGHGALASAYIGFVTIIALTVWQGSRAPGGIRFVVTFLLGLGLASAGGRAAVMALLLVLILLGQITLSSKRNISYYFGHVLVLFLAIQVAVAVVPRATAQASTLAGAVVGADGSFNARIPAWKGGARLLMDNPLFGVGPEGFAFGVWDHLSVGDRIPLLEQVIPGQLTPTQLEHGDYVISQNVILFRDPETGQQFARQLDWDKAHNYFIDLALTAGLPAAILWVGFVLSSAILMVRSRSSWSLGVALALIGFAVFSLAWFGTISLDPLIWGLVGTGLGAAINKQSERHLCTTAL